MGRCSALAGVDPTRRPQALGWLWLIFGPPAHLHVLCSIWAFLIRPKQNHRSGGANAVRLLSSSTQPQSNVVIDCMPQPNAWHDAWEPSLELSQHPHLLSPLRSLLHLFLVLSYPAFWVSRIWRPSTSSSFNAQPYGIYINVIYYSSTTLSKSHPQMLH